MLLRSFMIDLGSQETNLYLMADPAAGTGVLVDAGGFEPSVPELVSQLQIRLTHILLTHLHWDHVDALPRYMEQWPDAQVVAAAPVPGVPGARLVGDGEVVQADGFVFRVRAIPGHTPESVCYDCPGCGVVCFVGDSLMAGAVGGTSSDLLFGQQVAALRSKILSLPGHTELLPGHGPLTTVQIEKNANPFFRPGFGRTALTPVLSGSFLLSLAQRQLRPLLNALSGPDDLADDDQPGTAVVRLRGFHRPGWLHPVWSTPLPARGRWLA